MSADGLTVTAYDLARRLLGEKEIPGARANPYLSWALRLAGMGETPSDEIANCSAFVFSICHLLDLPRPTPVMNPARARSWLLIGQGIPLEQARPGFDLVVLKRGGGNQPGPEVLDAQGHVGFFAGASDAEVIGHGVRVLGANQGDAVSYADFAEDRVLGVRRLWP